MFAFAPIEASPTYDRWGTFAPSPSSEFFVSTNPPTFALRPSLEPGRRYENGPTVASGPISVGKARTAARFRRESRVFYNAYETGHAYPGTLDPGLVASPGGFPLVEGGKLIGAVGCSGGTGDQDAAVCKVGAEVVK